MKKSVILLILALACLLTLSACGCKHETWLDADCVNPKTCAECGEIGGAPLGHSWAAATCETAKTCEVCGEAEGEALGHSWAAATCETPKTCETCNLTEGEALGHSWEEATTETPKTCTNCGATEGTKIETDPRFTTAATASVQGNWSYLGPMPGDMISLPDYEGEILIQVLLTLGNDGTMSINIGLADEEKFKADMTAYMVEALYAQLAAGGLDKAGADDAMEAAYGMSVEEYAENAINTIDINELVGATTITGVYYVKDGKLYSATHWEAEFTADAFTLDGDTLTLEGDISGMGGEETVFTRIVE